MKYLLFAFLPLFISLSNSARFHKALETYDVGASSNEGFDQYGVSQDYADFFKSDIRDSDNNDKEEALFKLIRLPRPKKPKNHRSNVIKHLKSLIRRLESAEDSSDAMLVDDYGDRKDRPKIILVERNENLGVLVPNKRKGYQRRVPIQIPSALRSRGGEAQRRHTIPPPSKHVYEKYHE